MHGAAIIYFELGVVKNLMQKFQSQDTHYYFLIHFSQTKTTLVIFFNNWVNKGKQWSVTSYLIRKPIAVVNMASLF